ncbi:MAG: type II toxin-antitoxin system RelE/ParE family toxin [Bacteroidales bacterium]|nr:type II toxin-antitoxin system RelE/ParE family toxin [Clostridium sp.]MCM1204646.1 type II toxin-antitoxin system RelE/ParE family toxin [Bacteroidales bacterium]
MNDNYRVIYSPEALDDIRKIYSYIAFELQMPDTALNQVNRIRKEVRSLDFMPMRYSIVDWEPWKSMPAGIYQVDIDKFLSPVIILPFHFPQPLFWSTHIVLQASFPFISLIISSFSSRLVLS